MKSVSIKNETQKGGEDEKNYLHLMGHVNLNTLLYPGEKSCRIACPLKVYHETEMQKACGWECSYFRPKPPVVTEITTSVDKTGSKKSKKDQSDVSSKKSKSSKGSDGKSKSKGNKGGSEKKSVGVNLIEVLG